MLALCVHSRVAGAQSADHAADAQSHVERGLALYESKSYAEAAAELEIAYELKKDRDVLYALAQSRRLAGDCATAIARYRQFLDSNPPIKQADLARKNMARCEEAKPAAAPAGAPAAASAAPPSTTAETRPSVQAPERVEPPRPPRAAWYRDVPGDLLLGGGILGGVGGGYFFLATSSELQSARSANRYDDAQAHADRAHRDQKIAVIGSAVGGALVLSAIVRYVLHEHRPAPRTGATPTVSASAGGLVVEF